MAQPATRHSSSERAHVPAPWPPPADRPPFSAVVETRVGIVQYLPDDAHIGESIRWYGEYLQPHIDLLRRLIRPGATVVEAGAGIGIHSLGLANAVGEAGHLVLYESRPLHQRVLRQNVAANDMRNITVMRHVLALPALAATGVSSMIENIYDIGLERLDLLKINGSVDAMAVIAGAKESLWRLRPILFVSEVREDAVSSLRARAQDVGYRCWKAETSLFNPGNFNRRDEDVFQGKKIMAVLAVPEEVESSVARGWGKEI